MNYFSSIIGGTIYAYSPIVFQSLISGYESLWFSYAMMPLILFYFFKCFKENFSNLRNLVAFGITLALISFQIQFILLMGFLFVTYIIYHIWVKQNLPRLDKLLIPFIIALLINSYWFFPLIYNFDSVNSKIAATSASWNFLQTPDFFHSFLGWGSGYVYFEKTLEILEITNIWIIAYILILLSGVSYAILKKDTFSIYFIIILFVVAFVYKGINPPFGGFSSWLFQETVFGSFFRNAQYLAVLIVIPLSFIFTRFCNGIIRDFNTSKRLKFGSNRLFKILLFSIIVLPVIVYLSPWQSGDLSDQVNHIVLDEKYDGLENNFKTDFSSFKVLCLPTLQPVSYSNSATPHRNF